MTSRFELAPELTLPGGGRAAGPGRARSQLRRLGCRRRSRDGIALDLAAGSARWAVVASYGWQDIRLFYGDSSYVPEHGAKHRFEGGVIVHPIGKGRWRTFDPTTVTLGWFDAP